jgi:hypothetical protein
MKLSFQGDKTLVREARSGKAEVRLGLLLGRFGDQVARVTLRLSTVHGAGGHSGTRCQIAIRFKADRVRVEHTNPVLTVALDRAADKAVRSIARMLQHELTFAQTGAISRALEAAVAHDARRVLETARGLAAARVLRTARELKGPPTAKAARTLETARVVAADRVLETARALRSRGLKSSRTPATSRMLEHARILAAARVLETARALTQKAPSGKPRKRAV